MAGTSKSGNGNAKASTRTKSSSTYSNQNKKNQSSGGKKTSSSSYTSKRKVAARKALTEEETSRKNEIYVFVYLAIAIFLVCSNFGWCGVVGDFISKIFFGLIGSVQYLFPVYVFLSAAFLLSNGGHKKIVKRVLCVAIFLVALGFVCQLIVGAEDVSLKLLYQDGAAHKKGGGVLIGGLLVLLYKLTGLIGSIIITVLLTIIGIIIVMDVSLIDIFKGKITNRTNKTEDYEDEDYAYGDITRDKNQNMLSNSQVYAPEQNKKKAESKRKNKVVEEEEIHELKPVSNPDAFDYSYSAQPQDFFSKPDYNQNNNADLTIDNTDDTNNNEAVTELAPVKRKRKKTKESYNEMVAEMDMIAEDINKTSVSATDINTTATETKTSSATSDILKSTGDLGTQSIKEYKLPPISLLKTGKGKGTTNNEASVRETAMKLKSTLENFGVNVTVTDYSCGPSVTRYELQPEQGVKVSKIVNLADDIKLNLAAADIRIEAPIPGKAAIGIEVPNKESAPVYFGDLLESENFKKFPSNIAFAVGKDISGQVIVADIAKMPHVLVAGATGSGKSVCINTLIMSILYKANPNDVKLIMVDPKQVELSIYNGIPHMLIPVVTDPKKAAGALNWAVMEMTNRYQLFAQYNVRNLQGYNEKVKEVTGNEEGNEDLKKLPQIIIIVDELADLMMVAHGEVEDAIVRLSQLARAAGIHLVIATQRPSVDVITGLIKANVPSRIAMTVSSGVDSRTILDMNGAEKLLGKGDMLFYPTGYPKPVRVQGAFLSDDEIAGVVDFLKSQNGETAYDEKISQEIASSNVSGGGLSSSGGSDVDEYFVDAGKFIIGKDKASIGMLQRVYKIGFNRAARIMDQLSEAGVVGPEEGTKPRKVLMTMEEFENYVEEYL